MSKDAFYFKHDSNARNDEKVLALRQRFGMEGYGIYWAIIEKMRDSADYYLTTGYKTIAWELRCKEQTVKSIIEDFGLFYIEDGRFTSQRLRDDMHQWEERRNARAEAGRRGMQSRWKKNAEAPKEPPQTPTEQPPLVLTAEPQIPPAEPKKTLPKRYTDEQTELHSRCKEIFSTLYRQAKGAEFIWSAKEMRMLVDVISKVKSQMNASGFDSNNLDLVAYNFGAFVQKMFERADAWLVANASPSIMASKFNEIYTQIKNHTTNGNKPTTNNVGNARDNADFLASIASAIQSANAQ
ncbi:MAG: DUF4373 domain-containing protein [Bacteroidales bacterium]|nr:DUF4373 domain-containing protein [Bacteroidales bacterium]